jgi:hypothetical protein
VHVPSLKKPVSRSAAPPPSAAEGEVQVWREQGEICGYGYTAEGSNWVHLPNVATFRLGEEVVAFATPSATPDLIEEAFERSVLPLALQALGGHALHASGILGPAGVVALCGDSGTGKSTLAYALATRGYLPWADDAVAFEISDVDVITLRLPFRLRLRPDAFAVLNGGVTEPAKRRSAPLAAAVMLRREAGRPMSVRRLEGREAFPAALEDGYCYRPSDTEARASLVETYLELVARVPVFEVRFPPDWRQLDVVLVALEKIVRDPSDAEQPA